VKPLDPRLLQYSRSSRGFIFVGVLLATLNAALVIAQSIAIATLVSGIFQHHATVSSSRPKLLWLAIFFLGRGTLGFFTEYLAAISSTKMRNELRIGLLDKILSGRSRAIFNEGPATISLLATKGIDNLDGYFSRFLPQLFIAGVVPLTVGIAIASQDLNSGFIVLATVPLIPLFGILIGRFTGAATEKRWRTLSYLSGYFLDLLSGLPTLKVFGRSKNQAEKLNQVGEQYREETMKVLRISFLSALALEIIATLSVALIAVSIGLRLVGGSLSLKTGLFVLILSPEVYWPIRQVALYFHAAADGVEAANRIFTILEQPETDGTEVILKVDSIAWEELTVNFAGRNQITIPKGEVVKGKINVLAGPSGSGKSTFLAILLGFIANYSGAVIVASEGRRVSLTDMQSDKWRDLISWLPQEVNFPVGSVREILNPTGTNISDSEIIAALMRVGLSPADLPTGLNTQVGTLSETLSVGQKRKIALARALMKPAQVLILDEPSASVDDVSEADIASAIDSAVADGKIVILVTHRINLLDGGVLTRFGQES
jgi:ATP-binding cassette subfamily C protein CydCD